MKILYFLLVGLLALTLVSGSDRKRKATKDRHKGEQGEMEQVPVEQGSTEIQEVNCEHDKCPVIQEPTNPGLKDMVKTQKGRLNKYGETEACLLVQERISTYEKLSEMRSNTLPELQVIHRFVESLPERCKELYNEIGESNYSMQKRSIESKLTLHCKSLVNALPMYKWLIQKDHLVDNGADCYITGIRRAIEDTYVVGALKGKILPVYKSKIDNVDQDYTEFVFNEIVLLRSPNITTFSLKEYINFSDEYSNLVRYIKDTDTHKIDDKELQNLAKALDEEEYMLLVVEEHDNGEGSPFELKRFQTHVFNTTGAHFTTVGEGACHYDSQISGVVLALPVLFLFICAVTIPIIGSFTGLIDIPENCMDSMTYAIAPLAFVIGLLIPFVVNILPSLIGITLPEGHEELMLSLHFVIIIICTFRVAPLIGMVVFCLKAGLYMDYLREKWFLTIVTIGGVLGNLSWLILGMLMEMSYAGTTITESFITASKNMFAPSIEGEPIDMGKIFELSLDSHFIEESNFVMLSDLSIFILNASIFMFQSLILSQYISDAMCGRMGKIGYIALPYTFIGSNISYGLLFFCFSCLSSTKFYWNRISLVVGAVNLIFTVRKINCKSRVKKHVDPEYEEKKTVPEDKQAKRYSQSKNFKGMVKKLASKYGTPFVGVHREITYDIYHSSAEEKQNQFFLYAISGRRGTGKTRLIYECFKKLERQSDFKVLQGEASVKDDDKSKDMDLADEEGAQQNIKIQKCQPFEPIRKAIGNVVGINVFSSPSQQLSMIKNATDFADSFSGLSFLFSVENKDEAAEGNKEGDDSKQMSDVHLLADSLSKILIKEAKRYLKEKGRKLVLLFEDMEYADKNSLDFIRSLVKIFAKDYNTIPIIVVILYRDLPNTAEGESNEGKIQEILKAANITATTYKGGMMNTLVDKALKRKIDNKREEKDEKKEGLHVIAKHYQLTNLTEGNLEQLLNALCFVDEEIGDISKWLYNKTKGKLYWVSVCLQNLFIERYVEGTPRGWKIAPGKNLREITIPNKMAQALEVKFRKMEEAELKMLQMAAECGMHFNSNLIAQLLGKDRLDVIYQLNKVQEEYNVITENEGSAKRNDQGNDTLSGEFVFSSVVYVDAMRSMTRNYGNNLLFAKQIQLQIFDILNNNVNMSQKFLNSFFFYMDKFTFDEDQGELQFSLEERWGNAYIETTNFRKLPLEFKFRLAESANNCTLERPFECLVALSMAAFTAKDLWDVPNILKYSRQAINIAKSIIQNKEEIDELYEWLEKRGRCGFTSEEEIVKYTRHLLCELLIIESQNLLDSSPKDNSKVIIERLDNLESRIGSLPPKAQVIRALSYTYSGDLVKAMDLSEEIYDDPNVNKLYKADACYSACFAGFKFHEEEVWKKGIRCADQGIETMLEYLKEEKDQMKSRKIRQQAKEIMSKLLHTKGMIFQFRMKNLKEAEKCYIEALKYKKEINDILGSAKTNGLLGKLYFQIATDLKKRNDNEHSYSTKNDLEKASEYLKEYLKLSSKIENKIGLIDASMYLGSCYLELNEFDEAIKNYQKSAQRCIEYKETEKKVEVFCHIIKANILKSGADSDKNYQKYLDNVIEE